jgi:hypothetical protein
MNSNMTRFNQEIIIRFLFKVFVFSLSILGLFFLSNCNSSKEFIKFDTVRPGNQLAKAKEIDIDTFLIIWLENTQHSKVDFNLNELYQDSIFTYFGKQTFNHQNLYKIRKENLNSVDYKSIDGDLINERFYNDIIPAEDRNKQNQCSSASISIDYKYHYIESANTIEIECHYKVLCEFFIRIINKDYKAKYDIGKKTLARN